MRIPKYLLILFALFVVTGCNATTTTSGSSSQSQLPKSNSAGQNKQSQVSTVNVSTQSSVAFSYKGLDADKLSPTNLKPDGTKDGHFHITIPLSQEISIRSIWIRYNEFGKRLKWGWIYNDNLPLPCYEMTLFDSKGNQVLTQGDIGYLVTPVKGVVDLDLYISELNNENNRDTLKFTKGETFTLEVDYIMQNNDVGKLESSLTLT